MTLVLPCTRPGPATSAGEGDATTCRPCPPSDGICAQSLKNVTMSTISPSSGMRRFRCLRLSIELTAEWNNTESNRGKIETSKNFSQLSLRFLTLDRGQGQARLRGEHLGLHFSQRVLALFRPSVFSDQIHETATRVTFHMSFRTCPGNLLQGLGGTISHRYH